MILGHKVPRTRAPCWWTGRHSFGKLPILVGKNNAEYNSAKIKGTKYSTEMNNDD